jgi:hypothetical protein
VELLDIGQQRQHRIFLLEKQFRNVRGETWAASAMASTVTAS